MPIYMYNHKNYERIGLKSLQVILNVQPFVLKDRLPPNQSVTYNIDHCTAQYRKTVQVYQSAVKRTLLDL